MIRNRHSLSGSALLPQPFPRFHSQDLSYKEMEDELTCPVCLELFADPLMLPCSHSICKACLHDIMTSRVKAGKQGLDCPACRQNYYLTSDQVIKLPKNLALENIVFRYQEIHSCSLSKVAQLESTECSAASPTFTTTSDLCDENLNAFEEPIENCHCGMCEEPYERQAEWFCQQCQVFYCQPCLDTFHPKRGSLSKHKIRKPTLKESVECMLHCPDHNSESASIFCDTCKVVACHLCVCQGPGAHCGHIILDLETARKQLQDALQVAKCELSTLMTSVSDKNSVIDTHIQEIKDFEDSVKTIISSQYNCILFDIAATLNLVKKRSLESICAIANQHSSHFAAHSHQIKSVLQHCQNLGAACDRLLSTDKTGDIVQEGSRQEIKHVQSFSDVLHASSSKSFEGLSSTGGIPDSDILSDINNSNCKSRLTTVQQSDPFSSKCYSHDKKGSAIQPEINLSTGDQKIGTNKVKDVPILKNRSASDSKDSRRSSFFSERPGHSVHDFMTSSLRIKGSDSKVKSIMSHSDKFEGFDHARKHVADQNNSELKFSGVPGLKTGEKSNDRDMKEDGRHNTSRLLHRREERALNTPALTTFQNLSKEKSKPEDQLLLRAVEVGPVLKQVAALIRENECQKPVETEETITPSNDGDTTILTHVSDFHTSCLALLSNIADRFPSDYPAITPAVRSVITPLSLGQSALPRVQSRTLITWGFNSTTFTADPLEGCVQWSINVNRNSSHIGDIKTGYLFGIGVSTKPLSSKEQVGMTGESHAIACIAGQLVFCQDSVHNVVMSLTDLPICATIAVTISKVGLVMAYKLMMNGTSSAVCGQRVIAIDGDRCASGSQDDSQSEFKVYPVFTVSQRVKLQFPVSSNV